MRWISPSYLSSQKMAVCFPQHIGRFKAKCKELISFSSLQILVLAFKLKIRIVQNKCINYWIFDFVTYWEKKTRNEAIHLIRINKNLSQVFKGSHGPSYICLSACHILLLLATLIYLEYLFQPINAAADYNSWFNSIALMCLYDVFWK